MRLHVAAIHVRCFPARTRLHAARISGALAGNASLAWPAHYFAMNLAAMKRTAQPIPARVSAERWGVLPGGDPVRLFTMRNAHGMRVAISDLGATLVTWHAADRAGRIADVLLGHDTPAQYLA